MSGAQGDATVEQTDVGSYFIANYPPFSTWTPAGIKDAQVALTLRSAQGYPEPSRGVTADG